MTSLEREVRHAAIGLHAHRVNEKIAIVGTAAITARRIAKRVVGLLIDLCINNAID